jgi:hypothetical protein
MGVAWQRSAHKATATAQRRFNARQPTATVVRVLFHARCGGSKGCRMDITQRFIAYAGDFEKTFADDDWTRLRQYFADDAVYEVKSKSIGCRLTGPAAIFKGIKKSLDGFDRKFATRDIEVTSGPEISGDEMQIGWKVTYTKPGVPPFVLRGRSTARYVGDKIAYLSDAYDAAMDEEMAAWQRESGMQVDASYT